MFTLLTRWMLLVLTGFAILVSLTRTQPYRPIPTEDLPGAQPGCDSPCFMGIQVGRTTAAEALFILNQHPWVAQVTFADTIEIRWEWSGRQPDFIDARQPGIIWFYDNRATNIFLTSTIATGDWILNWGQPNSMGAGAASSLGRWMLYVDLGFERPSFNLQRLMEPCAPLARLWHQNGEIIIGPVHPPWDDPSQSRTLDSFMEFLQLLRENNCRR